LATETGNRDIPSEILKKIKNNQIKMTRYFVWMGC
jgi:hypothetical protein